MQPSHRTQKMKKNGPVILHDVGVSYSSTELWSSVVGLVMITFKEVGGLTPKGKPTLRSDCSNHHNTSDFLDDKV